MAPINPDVQQVGEPTFLNYFRPTSAPAVNTKAETALKATGNIFEQGVKSADQLMDKYATDKATDEATKFQQQKIQENTTMLDLLHAGTDTSGEGSLDSLDLQGRNPGIQAVAQKAADRASSLASANAQGKLTDTHYLGELNKMQFDLHSQFPEHYHSVIDRAVSKVTGFNVAEDLIKAQRSEINSFIGGRDAEREKLGTKLLGSMMLGQDEEENKQWTTLINKWFAKGPGAPSDDTMRSLLGRFESQDYRNKKEAQDLEVEAKRGQVNSDKANRLGSSIIMDKVQNHQALLDAHTNYESENAKRWAIGVMSGQTQVDDAVGLHYAQVFRLAKQQVSDQIDSALRQSDGYKYMDPTKIKAEKEAALTYYDQMASFFEDKEHGLAYYAKNLNSATAESVFREMTTNPSIPKEFRNALLTAKALNGNAPDWINKMIPIVMGNPNIGDALGSMILKQTFDLVTPKKYDMGTFEQGVPPAPDSFDSRFAAGAPATNAPTVTAPPLKKEDTIGGVVDKHAENGSPASVQKHWVDIVPTSILGKELPDENKKELLRRAFDPANFNFLQKYEEDHMEGGRRIPGQYAVLQHWTSPDMAKEVRRISQGDPHVWSMYTNWVHHEFFNVFDRDINELGDFGKFPGRKVLWNTDNPDNPHFILTQEPGQRHISSPEENSAEQKIDNINKGVQSIRNLHKAEGATPEKINAYLIQIMRDAGYDENKVAVDNVDNTSSDMLKAVLANSKPPEPAGNIKKPGSTKSTSSKPKKKTQ